MDGTCTIKLELRVFVLVEMYRFPGYAVLAVKQTNVAKLYMRHEECECYFEFF